MKHQRRWKLHKYWIKQKLCAVLMFSPNVGTVCEGSIVAAHTRKGTDGGTSLKPSDWWLIPLCDKHHREQHQIGEPAFERKYRIDMKATAMTYASKSPDTKMREVMKEIRGATP